MSVKIGKKPPTLNWLLKLHNIKFLYYQLLRCQYFCKTSDENLNKLKSKGALSIYKFSFYATLPHHNLIKDEYNLFLKQFFHTEALIYLADKALFFCSLFITSEQQKHYYKIFIRFGINCIDALYIFQWELIVFRFCKFVVLLL